ncbi:hypothetical protein QC761_0098540 [Podospora bellae-mahoneyi]|uniref:Uncharacterized protein n=1 Tax=Podospora bellae-mahoneyi TaxID=2093777 RepID=A0ABR0FAS1_9PEZI|nr:hypothetical protein QC761_0098540 [Podospora bellae-mahoneyi]
MSHAKHLSRSDAGDDAARFGEHFDTKLGMLRWQRSLPPVCPVAVNNGPCARRGRWCKFSTATPFSLQSTSPLTCS